MGAARVAHTGLLPVMMSPWRMVALATYEDAVMEKVDAFVCPPEFAPSVAHPDGPALVLVGGDLQGALAKGAREWVQAEAGEAEVIYRTWRVVGGPIPSVLDATGSSLFWRIYRRLQEVPRLSYTDILLMTRQKMNKQLLGAQLRIGNSMLPPDQRIRKIENDLVLVGKV